MNSNTIVFKGVPDGILIILDEDAKFSDLKDALVKKLKDNLDFFKEASTSISFKGRDISEEEEFEFIKIISKHSGLDISYVKDEKSNFTVNKTVSKSKEDFTEDTIIKDSMLNFPTENTYFYKGSVRGGQCLTHSGSIVVIGDVNPGSKIIAEGNIIILGKLKGIVHAGCKGMQGCFVSALYMNPTQLIINDIITYFPDDIEREIVPEYAYAKDGKIFVEQLIKLA